MVKVLRTLRSLVFNYNSLEHNFYTSFFMQIFKFPFIRTVHQRNYEVQPKYNLNVIYNIYQQQSSWLGRQLALKVGT